MVWQGHYLFICSSSVRSYVLSCIRWQMIMIRTDRRQRRKKLPEKKEEGGDKTWNQNQETVCGVFWRILCWLYCHLCVCSSSIFWLSMQPVLMRSCKRGFGIAGHPSAGKFKECGKWRKLPDVPRNYKQYLYLDCLRGFVYLLFRVDGIWSVCLWI